MQLDTWLHHCFRTRPVWMACMVLTHYECNYTVPQLKGTGTLSVSVIASWCVTCTSWLPTQLEESGDWRIDPRPNAQTLGLHSNVEFQPCEPPFWPRFFTSNRCTYGHAWAAMMRPLRTLRLDLCKWYAQLVASMCMSPRAWGGWCTE